MRPHDKTGLRGVRRKRRTSFHVSATEPSCLIPQARVHASVLARPFVTNFQTLKFSQFLVLHKASSFEWVYCLLCYRRKIFKVRVLLTLTSLFLTLAPPQVHLVLIELFSVSYLAYCTTNRIFSAEAASNHVFRTARSCGAS